MAIAVCALALLGCGGGGGATTTVTGKVSFEGKPATHGVVNFVQPGGRPFGGAIEADGTYKAELPAGQYDVRIDSPPRMPADWKEGDPVPKLEPRLIPEKYADFKSSGLTATIEDKSGTQQLDFPLP